MDFHAAMETFAEAWVAANTQTAVNSDPQAVKATPSDDLPTLLPKDQITSRTESSQPPGQTQPPLPPGTGVKSLPIHCLIEQTTGPLTFDPDTACTTTVELDSYAILPSTTQFHELVRASLVKLGYSAVESMNAKGAIQVKNWRPLSFDVITLDKTATLEDILGELTQVTTLRIRLCSQTKISSAEEIKGKLLQLLLTQSQDLLLKAGCPIEKDLLSTISSGENFTHLNSEVRLSFDKWYREQLLKSQKALENNVQTEAQSPEKPATAAKTLPTEAAPSNHSPSSVYMPLVSKTRMRTSFDPEAEIPRLQKWFQENQHPPRELMIRYLEELNSLESRKGRRPLDLTNIIYWFKNARAAHRRASRSYDGEGGFEMEESQDLSPGEGNHAYLNNKHPLYMLPYPFQGLYGSHDMSADMKEPCDLSQHAKGKMKDRSPSEEERKIDSKIYERNQQSQDRAINDRAVNEEGRDIKIEDKERKEEKEEPKGSPKQSDGPMPVLPNRNAVYVLPYPYHSNFNSKDPEKCNNGMDEKEPCDLSNSHKSKSSHDDITWQKEMEKPDKENRAGNENSQMSDDEVDYHLKMKNDYGSKSIKSPEIFQQTEGLKHSETNGVYRSGSEGEEMESDYDDDQSYDGSESSHDMNSLSIKQEIHDAERSFHGNKLSQLQQSAATGLHQPLHIPHFPHPLAMHYFPMNSHFLQQTARYQHQHQGRQQLSSPSEQHKSSLNDSHLHSNSHHRKRRTRVFIDPMSEIPKLEKWFAEDTHPSSYMIDKYCEELNRSEYRQKFPKLEAKNVQLWFKNHRAKVKRMRVSSVDLHNVAEYKMEKC